MILNYLIRIGQLLLWSIFNIYSIYGQNKDKNPIYEPLYEQPWDKEVTVES
jgi:hypothetical protein